MLNITTVVWLALVVPAPNLAASKVVRVGEVNEKTLGTD